jgi:hypothetical protein
MKKACMYMSYDEYHCNNQLFKPEFKHFFILKELFKKQGYDLSTHDINKPEESDMIIYWGMPFELPVKNHPNVYYMLFECEVVHPHAWKKEKYESAKAVFTWNDELIDNKKYFKFNFPWGYSNKMKIGLNHKDKFCTLIAGYKLSKHKLELYHDRIYAIRYFEKNHPDEFDLYGRGWPVTFDPDQPLEYFPSYRGELEDKLSVLERYKFSICYENARDIQGYITEKILDCFAAGCVPVYWGASNITDHIPAECFIDRRNFDNYDDLYLFMKNMRDEEYLEYQKNMLNFLQSDKLDQFSQVKWPKLIMTGIFPDWKENEQ